MAILLPGEEEEARYIAKRKMLGNIKFIGELGKLEMLHDSILHRCCEQVRIARIIVVVDAALLCIERLKNVVLLLRCIIL